MTVGSSQLTTRILGFALCILAVSTGSVSLSGLPGETLSGGEGTVFDSTRNAFSLPARNLREEHRSSFFVGNSFFNQNWIIAPASVAGRDGLGPLFNERSCSACHFKDGRSQPPEPGQPMGTMLLRISIPGTGPQAARNRILSTATRFRVSRFQASHARPTSRSRMRKSPAHSPMVNYSLRRPTYRITNPGYGPISPALLTSPRVSPAIIGLGLLEAIPDATLNGVADPDDDDHDGISGRLNIVWDHAAGRTAIGRFGWKAEQPSVLQQTAGAFLGDIGITTPLFPLENHTARQRIEARKATGGDPEASDKIFQAVALYARSLAVPAARANGDPQVVRGRQLFAAARCGACHMPEMVTGESAQPEFTKQTIRPYTDLLLHDMGDGLADGRPTFAASGREWRTPPLWGLGLIAKVNRHSYLLHDGRARNAAEAILWHCGEGDGSRQRFVAMSSEERSALLAFLDSL